MAGKGLARKGDKATGTCCNHKSCIPIVGYVDESEDSVLTESKPTALVGHKIKFNCGHYGTIVTGSEKSTIKDKAIGVKGSKVEGVKLNATIVEGSETVLADN